MNKFYKVINTAIALLNSKDGQGLMEYSMILLLIAIAAIAMMTPLGAQIAVLFVKVVDKF